jgi:hypothetical protein
MFGVAMTMGDLCPRFEAIGEVFLFPDISGDSIETQGNMPAGRRQGLVKIINHTVQASSREPLEPP